MKINSIRRKIFLSAGGLVVAAPAFAQLGGLGGLMGGSKGSSSGGGSVDADVKAFLDRSVSIERTVWQSATAIQIAYAKEKEAAPLRSRYEALSKATDPKEAEARFQEASRSAEADLKTLAESKDLEAQTKAMSAEKQKQVGIAVANILYAGFQAPGIIDNGKSIVGRVKGSPLDLPKVQPVTGAMERLGKAVTLSGSVMSTFVTVLKGVNVSVAPATASSKPVELGAL